MERMYLSKITMMLILLVGIVGFLFGAYTRPILEQKLYQKTGDNLGRFQLVLSPLVKTDKFLLDTQTGKIWQIFKPGELTDKSAAGYKIAKFDNTDSNSVGNKLKVSCPVNEKISRDKITKAKIEKNKIANAVKPQDGVSNQEVTVEVITNGAVSQAKVPHDVISGEKTKKEKVDSKNTLSEISARPGL